MNPGMKPENKIKKAADESPAQCVNVAAYCRISTDRIQQGTSLDTQIKSYAERIDSEADWRLAGIYADEGFSGTSAARRPEFQRMLRDCEAGRINLILCKSISRFARNTLECLEILRRLKNLNIGIVFEKEEIDTRNPCSDLMLTVWAAFAQEESRSISENVKWGIRKRYEAGQARWSRLYGYAKHDGKEYIIVEPEASIVRRVFRLYEMGNSTTAIADILTSEGAVSSSGSTKWSASSIGNMLGNERYVGDIRLQRYYTVDHLTHRSVTNDGSLVPSYYIHGHHTPLVSRKQWERVQAIKKMNCRIHGACAQYPYAGRLICPFCGDRLCKRRFDTNTALWVCGECGRFSVRHEAVNRTVLRAWSQLRPADAGKTGEPGRLKRRIPEMHSVEYWWLDETVERIEFFIPGTTDAKGTFATRVCWKDGTTTEIL